MRHQPINPAQLGAPKGYNNGVLCQPGRLLCVAGQIAWDEEKRFVSAEFGGQFRQALANVLAVVQEAGGGPADVAAMRIYVTDKNLYNEAIQEVGRAYRELMGKNFPAMALVQVQDLLEDEALVEIEATAVIGC